MSTVNFQMFKLDLEKSEKPEIKLINIYWIIEKARKFQKKIYFCFIDYAKAFECMDHHKLENSERDGNTRPPDLPLEKPVCSQEAIVRTGHGTTDWFQIGKGVCQGCILSACLFNICRVHHEKRWAGRSTSWNQDCREKYQ